MGHFSSYVKLFMTHYTSMFSIVESALRNGDKSNSKLTNGDYPSGDNRYSVGAVFEGDMNQGKSEECYRGFVFIAPSIPFGIGRVRCTKAGTGKRVFTYVMLAGSAGFHDYGPVITRSRCS
jgi:hypothetical protein